MFGATNLRQPRIFLQPLVVIVETFRRSDLRLYLKHIAAVLGLCLLTVWTGRLIRSHLQGCTENLFSNMFEGIEQLLQKAILTNLTQINMHLASKFLDQQAFIVFVINFCNPSLKFTRNRDKKTTGNTCFIILKLEAIVF